MNVTVCVCTYGDREWAVKADEALRSADDQGATHTYAYHSDRGSLADARNQAAKVATTDWLCFLDADDRLAPGYIAAMAAVQEPDWLALLVPSVQYGDRDHPRIPAWDRSMLDVNCAVIGTLISRNLFLRVGGFREWATLEDWELWLRCIRLGAKMHAVPAAVYQATVNPYGRNADQSPYAAIRAEHRDGFDWDNVDGYKVQPWQ